MRVRLLSGEAELAEAKSWMTLGASEIIAAPGINTRMCPRSYVYEDRREVVL